MVTSVKGFADNHDKKTKASYARDSKSKSNSKVTNK